MRSLKQVILDFIFKERTTYLSTTSMNYWLRIESKREAEKQKFFPIKRTK